MESLDWLYKVVVLGVIGLQWWQLRSSLLRLEQGQNKLHQRINKVEDAHTACMTDTVQRLAKLETRMDAAEKIAA